MPIDSPPRAVVDTNVLISYLLSPRGAASGVFIAIAEQRLVLVITPEIEAEYREVSTRATVGVDKQRAEDLIDSLVANAEHVTPARWRGRLPDRADEMFVRAALATGTRIVTTHNLRHYPRSVCAPVRIMKPGQLLAWLRRRP